jgi:hypothetical protein
MLSSIKISLKGSWSLLLMLNDAHKTRLDILHVLGVELYGKVCTYFHQDDLKILVVLETELIFLLILLLLLLLLLLPLLLPLLLLLLQ